MPGTISPPSRVSDPDLHHRTCVTHVPWCMPGPLTSGFLWSRWRGKRSRYSRRMRSPRFCVSGKRPMYTGGEQWFAGQRTRKAVKWTRYKYQRRHVFKLFFQCCSNPGPILDQMFFLSCLYCGTLTDCIEASKIVTINHLKMQPHASYVLGNTGITCTRITYNS